MQTGQDGQRAFAVAAEGHNASTSPLSRPLLVAVHSGSIVVHAAVRVTSPQEGQPCRQHGRALVAESTVQHTDENPFFVTYQGEPA